VIKAKYRPLYPSGSDQIPILQEVCFVSLTVWSGKKIFSSLVLMPGPSNVYV